MSIFIIYLLHAVQAFIVFYAGLFLFHMYSKSLETKWNKAMLTFIVLIISSVPLGALQIMIGLLK